MYATATAIYEKGFLRLLTPLAVPEHAQVQIRIEQVSLASDALEHRRQVRAVLVAAGLGLPDAQAVVPQPLAAERREELARRFSVGRPLSELILEEREGR